jgi:hypothetical protein
VVGARVIHRIDVDCNVTRRAKQRIAQISGKGCYSTEARRTVADQCDPPQASSMSENRHS